MVAPLPGRPTAYPGRPGSGFEPARACGWPNIHPDGSLARRGRARMPCGKGRTARRACWMRGRDHGEMELTDFEALSFDCYGTLIDWEAGLTAVLVPWARQRGVNLGGEELLT